MSAKSGQAPARARRASPPPAALLRPARVLGAFGRYALLFALLPNLPFWLLAPRLGIVTPGLLNVDALLLGLLALYLRPGWLVGLYAADFALDIVYGIRATYGTNYVEIFLSLRYAFAVISRRELIEVAALAVAIVALIGAAWIYWRPRLRGSERALLTAVLALVLVPLALASRTQRTEATRQQEANWQRGIVTTAHLGLSFSNVATSSLRSPTLALYHAWRREDVWAWLRGRYSPTAAMPSASAHATALLGGAPPRPNLVLVLVESWGEADSDALRNSLLAPFHTPGLAARYQLSQGLAGFQGTTAGGELRELCNYRLAVPTAPLAISSQDLSRCLPWRLRQQGYQTLALDSAADFWPGGANWYGLLGFQRVMTFDSFHRLGLPTFIAGPFRSIRDQEVAGWIANTLSAPTAAPRLVFWLTMSAHLPVHLPLSADYSANCALAPVTQRSSAACGWYKVELRTLESIAAAAAAPRLAPTLFLVVGDHAPPFLDAARDAFSPTQVPYVLLAPRAANPEPPHRR